VVIWRIVVSALEVLRNRALQIDIYLLIYVLSLQEVAYAVRAFDWYKISDLE